MDLICEIHKAVRADNTRRALEILRKNPMVLVEGYTSPKLNDKMIDICQKFMFDGHCLGFLIPRRVSNSLLSKAIKFNAIGLFSLLKEHHGIIAASSPHGGIPNAMNSCSNSRMILECFENHLIDLRFPNGYQFLARTEMNFDLVKIPRFFFGEYTESYQRTLYWRTGYNTQIRLDLIAARQHFLDRALHYGNVDVAKECLRLGIRPSKQPESEQMQRLVAFCTNPNHEFNWNDYPFLPTDIQKKIFTVMSLTVEETLLNMLPAEVKNHIFGFLV